MMVLRKSIAFSLFFAMVTIALLTNIAEPAKAASNPGLWCWSMQSGTIKGTFLMSPGTAGDGTANSGLYTITGFSVYESAIANLNVGSIADGTYTLGTQEPYQIQWDGSAATMYRRNGHTNGFGIYSNLTPAKDSLVFDVSYQSSINYSTYTSTFSSSVAPTLSPAPASGLCPGQSAPSKTVTFDQNFGPSIITTQSSGTPAVLTLNSFTRSGYTFSGWNTVPGGQGGQSYSDGQEFPFDRDQILYAQWTANPIATGKSNNPAESLASTGLLEEDGLVLGLTALVMIVAGLTLVIRKEVCR